MASQTLGRRSRTNIINHLGTPSNHHSRSLPFVTIRTNLAPKRPAHKVAFLCNRCKKYHLDSKLQARLNNHSAVGAVFVRNGPRVDTPLFLECRIPLFL